MRLAGTHFGVDFSKLAFYLFAKLLKKLIFAGTILAKIGQIANFAKVSTRKQMCP